MTYRGDWHVHSNFCDGKNSLKELLDEAVKKELNGLGVVFHSHTEFDKSYCIKKEDIPLFFKEANNLKSEFGEKIKFSAGTEQDYFSEDIPKDADYIIGSCHYIKVGDNYIPVDETKEIMEDAAEKFFNGSFLKLAEVYFSQVATVAKKTKCDIVGHFDLITKFDSNENVLFKESREYKNYALCAADEIMKNCKVFELNTGVIFRGYKKNPYPADFVLRHLKQKNADIILSGDAHCGDALCFGFDEAEKYLKSIGFEHRVVLTENGFEKVKLT